MKKLSRLAATLGLGSTVVAVASATLVPPTSYDMLNGNGQASGGSYNYWDEAYTGTGSTTTDNAALSGGLGDLTDGVIATDNWYITENGAGTGPYVGWVGFDPTVDFHFASATPIDQITVYADDSDGAGGVSLPDAVIINGTSYDVDQFAAGSNPKALTFSGLNLATNDVQIQFVRSNQWVFVSEVQFQTQAVPEPATTAVLGLGALGLIRRRKNR